MGIREIGLDFQHLTILDNGLVEPPAIGQGVAEVVVGHRVVGLDLQGLLVLGDGLVDSSPAG